MKAFNKRRKPKHTTKCKYKLGEATFKYSKRVAVQDILDEKCFIWEYKKWMRFNIPRYGITFTI